VRFLILGRFEVERDGAVLDLGARLQRAVLARLVLHAGRMVSAERLTEDLWGQDPPPKALASLQAYVANLRRVLEPEREVRAPATVLRTQPPGYLLDLSDHQLDAVEFERLAAACRAHLAAPQPWEARRAADAALALWRGPVLEDLSDLQFVQDEAARLDTLRAAAVEIRLQALLESGEHAAALGELRGLTTRHPLRERGWELLMLALYRSGRIAEALDAYREAVAVLRDELGLDPGQDLRALHERILRRDPALEPPAATPATPAAIDDPATPIVAPSLPPDPETPLIGRAHDLDAVMTLLGTTRVVTIVGPGGVGKTRLALRAACSPRPPTLRRCWSGRRM
jgi:DNA-binding SARP family transcriptional activator